MSKYLLSTPDRYGRFGHQTSCIAAALILSHLTNCRLILPRYMFCCDKWNKYSDFLRSKNVATSIDEKSVLYYLEKDLADQNGNRKWDLAEKNQIIDIVNKIRMANDNTICHLPFDQSAGILLKLLNKKNIREDFRNILSSLDQRENSLFPYACVHIRRGDCTRKAYPQWYVEDDFYIQILELLLSILPSEYKVYVCTQGDVGWLNRSEWYSAFTCKRLIKRSTNQLFINDSEVDNFILMKNANMIFCASSAFSHWASYLGRHNLVVDITRSGTHALTDTINVNPDSPLAYSMQMLSDALDVF